MEVKNSWDELWIGVKGQSNLVIAGSLRNILRYSLKFEAIGGRALIGLGLLTAVPNPVKLRIPVVDSWESDYE